MPITNPTLETLLVRVENKYALINGVAKRARQLKEGHLPMVDIASTNPVTVALEEVAAGKVRLELGADLGQDRPSKVRLTANIGDVQKNDGRTG